MLDFTFCSPTQFYFGRDTQQKAGSNLCRRFWDKKCCLHYGGGSVVRSGLLDDGEAVAASTRALTGSSLAA